MYSRIALTITKLLTDEETRRRVFKFIIGVVIIGLAVPICFAYSMLAFVANGVGTGDLSDVGGLIEIGSGILSKTDHDIIPIMTSDYTISIGYNGTDAPYTADNPHKGIDFVGQDNINQIMSMLPGEVESANNDCPKQGYLGSSCGGGFGNHVVINTQYHGNTIKIIYGHMQEVNVAAGDKVKQFEPIGIMGQSGNVTGAHLHFETYYKEQLIDPNLILNYVNNQYKYTCANYIENNQKNDPTLSTSVNYQNEYVASICSSKQEINTDIGKDKKDIMSAVGISEDDYQYVDYIVSHESSWDYQATNESSGAYGLCQALPGNKMAESGSDWKINPITQMDWCNNYALDRYGSWQKAEIFWKENHWW